jgi:hypothetical protein
MLCRKIDGSFIGTLWYRKILRKMHRIHDGAALRQSLAGIFEARNFQRRPSEYVDFSSCPKQRDWHAITLQSTRMDF